MAAKSEHTKPNPSRPLRLLELNADNRIQNTERLYISCSKNISVRFFSDQEAGINANNCFIAHNYGLD
jgi:hypothetical protein